MRYVHKTPTRDRISPEGKAMTPPLSASLSTTLSHITHTFVVPKTAGLGVIIGGGEGKPDGPYIIIDKILDGMDAAKVSPFLHLVRERGGAWAAEGASIAVPI